MHVFAGNMNLLLLLIVCFIHLPKQADGFAAAFPGQRTSFALGETATEASVADVEDDSWKGQVTTSEGGIIKGCNILLKEGALTEWTVTIDGNEADLSGFSEAIYKKITADARQQRFQGFRPGTIPPHLEPTYRAFTMDECARETVLEALQQNNIRPFEQTRADLIVRQVSIPPPPAGRKKKSKKRKKKSAPTESPPEPAADSEPKWRLYDDMKGAIDAGWRPGQSFSFVATNVRGQQLKEEEGTTKPLGVNF